MATSKQAPAKKTSAPKANKITFEYTRKPKEGENGFGVSVNVSLSAQKVKNAFRTAAAAGLAALGVLGSRGLPAHNVTEKPAPAAQVMTVPAAPPQPINIYVINAGSGDKTKYEILNNVSTVLKETKNDAANEPSHPAQVIRLKSGTSLTR